MSTVVLPRPARRPSVRLLVMGWAIWLLVTWAAMMGRHGVGDGSGRGLMVVGVLGMLLIWPAVRLGQLGSVSGVALDWVAMNALWQMVVWPIGAMQLWPAAQAVWLSVAAGAWSAWIGLLIALGGLSHRGEVRAAMMAACVLLLAGEPMMMALRQETWRTWISPVGALGALTQKPGYFEIGPWRERLAVTAAAGAGAWAALGVCFLLWPRRMR